MYITAIPIIGHLHLIMADMPIIIVVGDLTIIIMGEVTEVIVT